MIPAKSKISQESLNKLANTNYKKAIGLYFYLQQNTETLHRQIAKNLNITIAESSIAITTLIKHNLIQKTKQQNKTIYTIIDTNNKEINTDFLNKIWRGSHIKFNIITAYLKLQYFGNNEQIPLEDQENLNKIIKKFS